MVRVAKRMTATTRATGSAHRHAAPKAPAHGHGHASIRCGADWLAHVDRECARRGLRMTPSRHQVVALIAAHRGSIKAYELLAELKRMLPKAAPPTIYRALDFLLAHGFIHRIESINAYAPCVAPGPAGHAAFLICDVCHAAEEVDESKANAALDAAARRAGFAPVAQTLEVHGVCRDCQAAVARRSVS